MGIESARQKMCNAVLFIRKFGMRSFVAELDSRMTNHYHDLRLGVDTGGEVKKQDLGFFNPEMVDYNPMGYRGIYSMLKRIPLDMSTSTFLDYGSGKGRAIVVAATFPFERVIGIEISGVLLAIANKNVDAMRYKRAKRIELHKLDAMQYSVPKDVNIIYFFNPFKGQILQKVVDRIYDSYKQYPRNIYIIFFNNDHFENIIKNQKWITRIYQGGFYRCSVGLYVSKAS